MIPSICLVWVPCQVRWRRMHETLLGKPHFGAQSWWLYHRRVNVCCCILAGEMDNGGLATLIPVLGLTIGMAFLVRMAEGWWIFSWVVGLLLWKPEFGLYELVEADDIEKLGATCGVGWIWSCNGDDSGEPLDSDERSDDEEWIDCN